MKRDNMGWQFSLFSHVLSYYLLLSLCQVSCHTSLCSLMFSHVTSCCLCARSRVTRLSVLSCSLMLPPVVFVPGLVSHVSLFSHVLSCYLLLSLCQVSCHTSLCSLMFSHVTSCCLCARSRVTRLSV